MSPVSPPRPPLDEVGHVLAEAFNPSLPQVCPLCRAKYTHFRVVDYDELWRDGRVVCECGQFIRTYDAG